VDPKTSPVLAGGAASSFHREKKGRSGELDIDYSEETIPPKETVETEEEEEEGEEEKEKEEEDGEEDGEEEGEVSGVKKSAAAHVQQPLVVQAFYYSEIVL
jgi:hypothetical protein